MSCGVGHRHGSDLALLWLWCRPAGAAPIQPLAWELPCAVGVALKKEKKRRGKEIMKGFMIQFRSVRHRRGISKLLRKLLEEMFCPVADYAVCRYDAENCYNQHCFCDRNQH